MLLKDFFDYSIMLGGGIDFGSVADRSRWFELVSVGLILTTKDMHNPRNDKFRVIQPGISISSRYSTNGTLGLIVFDLKNNFKPCILSNWHILAKSSFIPGLSFHPGNPVYQPGRLITNRIEPDNIVARLTRYDRSTDSAIAEILSEEYNLEQFESKVLITSARMPYKGDIVEKSGARTGITRGRIVDVNGSFVKIKPLDIQHDENVEISSGGDSGSIWYDPDTKEGLVLHNHGEPENSSSPEAEYSGGYSLVQVIERLKISLRNN